MTLQINQQTDGQVIITLPFNCVREGLECHRIDGRFLFDRIRVAGGEQEVECVLDGKLETFKVSVSVELKQKEP